jgi:hypothetical protein
MDCGFFWFVRPAWALSWRWKSSRDQAIESEANGNCARATERGKEAGSVSRGPMNKNRIRGDVERGERANDREASMAKAQAA